MSDQLTCRVEALIGGGTDGGENSISGLNRFGVGGGGPDSAPSAGDGGACITGRGCGSCNHGQVVICGCIDSDGGCGGLGFVAIAVSATAGDWEFDPSANAVSTTAGA